MVAGGVVVSEVSFGFFFFRVTISIRSCNFALSSSEEAGDEGESSCSGHSSNLVILTMLGMFCERDLTPFRLAPCPSLALFIVRFVIVLIFHVVVFQHK